MSAPKRYRVVAVEPDERFRTRLTIQLAATEATVSDTIESLVATLDGNRPTVVVFGPGLANDTGLAQAQRLSRQHPEMGVVLVSEELSLGVLAAFGWSLYALFFGDAGLPGMRMTFRLLPEPGSGADEIYLEVAAAVTVFILAGRYFEARYERELTQARQNYQTIPHRVLHG